MSSTQTVTNYSNSTSSTSTSTSTSSKKSTGTVSKDMFMKMLIAQLQNQDPLNPMDGTQFAAQLAQFSTLEQLQNLNDTMSSIPTYMGSFSNAQVAGLIGKDATGKGNVLQVSGSSTKISYNLPSAVASGTISIYNGDGLLVDKLNIGSQKAGLQSTIWNSSKMTAGNYTFEIDAKDKSGSAVTVDKLVNGTITGVSFKNNQSYLVINGQEVAFSDVTKINTVSN